MNNSIQFRVNSYMQLARLCDDEMEKRKYIEKAEYLLEQYEEILSIRSKTPKEVDDWKIGIIEDYIKDKKRVCVIEIWQEALYKKYSPCYPELSRKQSNSIVDILVNRLGCERGNSENFDGFGKQKAYYTPQNDEVRE